MAKSQVKGKATDKWKRKKWFHLIAPKLFSEQVLGETPADEPDMVKGRTVEVNLMMLTGNMKLQNINVTFEVTNVQGANAYTEVKKFEIQPASIKRRVRRRKDKLDDSFICVTRDNKMIRLKPLIITNSKSSSSIKAKLRRVTMLNLQRSIRTVDYDTLVTDIVNNKLQKDMRNTLHKTFPVKIFDIRMLETVKEDQNKLAAVVGRIAAGEIDAPDSAVEIEEATEEEAASEETEEQPQEETAEQEQ
jgi:small subunit ribosomal protein S3Ae